MMKTFILGMMAGVTLSNLLMENKKSVMKKGKQALKDKIEDILS